MHDRSMIMYPFQALSYILHDHRMMQLVLYMHHTVVFYISVINREMKVSLTE